MAEASKKKGKKGLIIGLVLLFVFGGVGAVFGLALSGKINIPGITPKKKPIPPLAAKKKPDAPAATSDADNAPKDDPVEPKKASPESIKQGAAKLAEVWNEMPADKLSKVVAKWKPDELAIVLNEMDPTKVAEILAAMDEKKASLVSQALKDAASQIPAE